MQWSRDGFIDLCKKAVWPTGAFDRASVLRQAALVGTSSALFYYHWRKALKMEIVLPIGNKLYIINPKLNVAMPPLLVEKKEREPTEMAKVIINYLNAVTGRKFRASGQVLGNISARLREGYTYNDFVLVIDKKNKEWSNTKMAKYIRPLTLFSPKFDTYLNQAEEQTRADKLGGYAFEKYFN